MHFYFKYSPLAVLALFVTTASHALPLENSTVTQIMSTPDNSSLLFKSQTGATIDTLNITKYLNLDPVSIALICAGLVAIPFTRYLRKKHQ